MIRYKDRWAVVTGASSGLGRGLAARLADRGMSLVLTGRNEARLNEVAHENCTASLVQSFLRPDGRQPFYNHAAAPPDSY